MISQWMSSVYCLCRPINVGELLHLGLKIEKALNLSLPVTVAVIGCGGKTSLIKLLAESYPEQKVLISPTTKMFPPKVQNADCMGMYNHKTGKLEALPPEKLAELISNYDISLLEADGSRGLFCKGWLNNEPVVPEYCTHTIGMATLNALGKNAMPEHVHNLPQFLTLTGLNEGEIITEKALRKMVCAPLGMFKNSAGCRILIVNQVENESDEKSAENFLRYIKQIHPGMFTKLLYGSVFNNVWFEV